MDFKQWLVELDASQAKHAHAWLKNEKDSLPFSHIFSEKKFGQWVSPKQIGQDINLSPHGRPPVTRLILPVKSQPQAISILQKVRKLGYKINFRDGTATGTVQTQRGSKDRTIKLGKFIQSNEFTDQEKKWWTSQGGKGAGGDVLKNLQAAEVDSKYSIIVSRHPIDVIRMSDHEGLRSCHSPGREYFNCAVNESRGEGAIAYLVNKDDLQYIDDLQQDEIFVDRVRGISGIKPLARLRIRQYIHQDKDYQLAVPEEATYGSSTAGFVSTVTKWARKQLDGMENKRPRMKEFKRMGGSYQDSNDGDLFNNFFGDNLDHGNTEFGGQGEYAGQADVWAEEIETIDEELNKDFKWVNASAEVEEVDGAAYVSIRGTIGITIPQEMFIKDIPDWGFRYDTDDDKLSDEEKAKRKSINDANRLERHRLKKGLEDAAHAIDIYEIQDVDFDTYDGHDSVWVRVDFDEQRDGDDLAGPDRYRQFLEWVRDDVDPKGQEFANRVYHILIDGGYIKPTYAYKAAGYGDEKGWAGEEDEHDEFANFSWSEDDKDYSIEVELKQKQLVGSMKGLPNDGWKGSEGNYWNRDTVKNDAPGFSEFYKVLFSRIQQMVQVYNQKKTAQFATAPRQLSLPGWPKQKKPQHTEIDTIKVSQPEIYFSADSEDNVFFNLSFKLPWAEEAGEVENTSNFIHYLDSNWYAILPEAQKVFDAVVKRHYLVAPKPQEENDE